MSQVQFSPYGSITAYDTADNTKSLKLRSTANGFHITPAGTEVVYLDVKTDGTESLKLHRDADGLHVTPVGGTGVMFLDAAQVKYKYQTVMGFTQIGSLWDIDSKQSFLKANIDENRGFHIAADNQIIADLEAEVTRATNAENAMRARLVLIENWILSNQT